MDTVYMGTPAMVLDVPSMGSNTRVSSNPLSTYPISSLRTFRGTLFRTM